MEVEEIAKIIDPDNIFLDKCEEIVNNRFGEYKEDEGQND